MGQAVGECLQIADGRTELRGTIDDCVLELAGIGLQLFVMKTKTGKAMRAVSFNPTAASLVGNFALTDRLDAAALTAEADLRSRAEDRGGSLTLDEGDEKGFRLPWAIPIG